MQLRHRSFIEKVREIVMRTAYPVSLLEFEVTETAFVINKRLAFSVLHHHAKMGISIALDDFGTSCSSLSMLRDFHFRRHQARPQLYDGCGEQPSGTLIRFGEPLFRWAIRSIRRLSPRVETAGQLQILEEEGCDEMRDFCSASRSISNTCPTGADAPTLRWWA